MGLLSSVLRQFFYLLLGAFLLIVLSNVWVVQSTSERVFVDSDSLPEKNAALVLGTSHLLTDGSPNPFFDNRIRKAADLYRDGKISHIIVSGDNRTKYYNEPLEMRKALVGLGVPQSAITLDYAGLRTLDSVVRSREIFGQDHITIITQAFHSYRALFISDYYGIQAVVSVADDPEFAQSSSVYVREYFARTKAILDLYILKTEPHHLGEKEPLNI